MFSMQSVAYQKLRQNPYVKWHQFSAVPIHDVFLMDQRWFEAQAVEWAKMTAGQPSKSIGYILNASPKKRTRQALELLWYPNIYTRFHRVSIILPKSDFICCLSFPHHDEKPFVFVSSKWIRNTLLRRYSIFALIDVIGVKNAIRKGLLTRGKLLKVRAGIDSLTKKYPEVSFVSFADSLLLKTIWETRYAYDSHQSQYKPEQVIQIIGEISDLYKAVLGLKVYSILTQGANEYYKDASLHISDSKRHISLNSLGIPFAQLQAIDLKVHKLIKKSESWSHNIYLDSDLFYSLKFPENFSNEGNQAKHHYLSPLEKARGTFHCFNYERLAKNIINTTTITSIVPRNT